MVILISGEPTCFPIRFPDREAMSSSLEPIRQRIRTVLQVQHGARLGWSWDRAIGHGPRSQGDGADRRDVFRGRGSNGHFRNAGATTRSLLPVVYT
jgi:hypothetical protein